MKPRRRGSDIRQSNIENLALLVTPTEIEQKLFTAARQEVLKAMGETAEFASAQVDGLIEIISHINIAKNHACMTAKQIMDVYQGSLFYITIVSFSKVDVHLPKHQMGGEVANVPVEMVYIKDERYSYLPDTHANNSERSVSAVNYKAISDRLDHIAEQKAVK